MSRHSRLDQIVTAALYWFIGAMSGILLLMDWLYGSCSKEPTHLIQWWRYVEIEVSKWE